MDFTASQYSGGGDSGWTMYLEQSYVSRTQNDVGYDGFYGRVDEEDLSMVSDASSGPRCNNYYDHHDGDCYYQDNNNGFWLSGSSSSSESTKKKTKNKKEKAKNQKTESYGGNCNQMYSCLDDTASSAMQVFSSQKEYSTYGEDVSAGNTLGFSETRSQGKSGLRKHLKFFQSSEKSASEGKGNGTHRRNR